MAKQRIVMIIVIFGIIGIPVVLAQPQVFEEQFPLPELEVISVENAERTQHLGTLEGFTDWTLYAAFSPDGRIVAATGWHDGARIWDVQTGRLLRSVDCPEVSENDWTGGITFSPDGALIAVGCENSVLLWNTVDLLQSSETTVVHPVQILQAADTPLGKIIFNSEGTYLAATDWSGNQEIWLWSIESNTPIAAYRGDTLCCPNFSPDGVLLAYSNGEKTTLINIETLEKVSDLPFPSKIFSTDWVLSADIHEAFVRLWVVEDETFPTILKKDNYIAGVLAFSPDRSVLVSGSDFELLFWNTTTAKLLTSIRYGGFSSIVFSPDSRLIVTTHTSAGGAFTGVNLWGIPTLEARD